MPDTLNPASVRAACDAMRAAYRPDCILLRPDAMEAAIGAFLAAEADRGMKMMPRDATRAMLSAASLVSPTSISSAWHTGHERLLAYLAAEHAAMWDAAALGTKP